MALSNEIIKQKLSEKFGEELTSWEETYGILTFSSHKDLNLKILQFLFDDPRLQFRFLTDLCGVHYPEKKGEELSVSVQERCPVDATTWHIAKISGRSTSSNGR